MTYCQKPGCGAELTYSDCFCDGVVCPKCGTVFREGACDGACGSCTEGKRAANSAVMRAAIDPPEKVRHMVVARYDENEITHFLSATDKDHAEFIIRTSTDPDEILKVAPVSEVLLDALKELIA